MTSDQKKWVGAFIGAVLGPVDTLILRWIGVSFEINGGDASWVIGLYFGLSFAVLGYLVVTISESRVRDREQAQLLGEQRELLHRTRTRLAQSEKLAALGQLATMIAHEVRNPLGVMRSSAQEIGDAVRGDANASKASSFIIAEVDRLNRVIESILGFAKPIEPDFTTVRLGDLAERAILLAGEHIRSRDCRMTLDRGPDRETEVDSDLVTQVLLDTIANALEASPTGGEVHIEISDGRDGDIVIAVCDQGAGVEPAERETIFEPFYTTRAGGTGLGLAVARQIVAGHGGTFTAVDSPRGARFEIRLPRRRDELAA